MLVTLSSLFPKRPFILKVRRYSMSSSAPADTAYYKHGLISLTEDMRMEECVAGLSEFKKQPFTASAFVKPASVSFEQSNGTKVLKRRWDMIEAHDSIAVILYHRAMDCLLMVRQFRPAVYARLLRQAEAAGNPTPAFAEGFTYELCAGLVDKDKSLEEIAHEEIMEECGFNVPVESIKEITSFIASIGTAGTKQSLFFAEVKDEMRLDGGGGGLDHDGEAIEVLALPTANINDFVFDTSLPKSTGLMFAFLWIKEQLKKRSI